MSRLGMPNPLAEREPQLAERLAAFRLRVNDLLVDQLPAELRRDSAA
jgi:hypothetical protein